ncbi:Uncharacterised protein [Mycobacterium tuberculosis]|nr:Uncharacterised protein [Mycobacterium tuberculosis]
MWCAPTSLANRARSAPVIRPAASAPVSRASSRDMNSRASPNEVSVRALAVMDPSAGVVEL